MEHGHENLQDKGQVAGSPTNGRPSSGAPLAAHAGDGRQAILARLSTLVNASGDLHHICEAIIDEAAAMLESDAASVFVTTGNSYLRHVASFGLSQQFVKRVEDLASTTSSSGFLGSSTEPTVQPYVLESDVAPVYRQLLESESIVALCSLPLLSRDKLYGFMTLYMGHRHDFSDEDVATLQTLANLLALAVANLQFIQAKQGEDQARDRFLSALSHELRTPLTSIMGFTQVMRKRMTSTPGADPRMVDQLEVLWTQAQRLNRLIDTFVDLSHIERGEFAINSGKIDLSLILRAAVNQARAQARANQAVETHLSEPAILVHGDGRRLEQVFTHLLSNALRYSPPDQPVTVNGVLDRLHGRITLTVLDHGPGIPPHVLKDIFERSSPGDAQRSGGLGVGLYLSKNVIEAHGGTISIQSSPVNGTTVTVVLPT